MKRIILGITFAICSYAQQQTVFLASNSVPNSGIIVWNTGSTTNTNINYNGTNTIIHHLTILSNNAPAQTCTGAFTPLFQGSFDNTIWLNLYSYTADAEPFLSTNASRTIVGEGAYPYLRGVILASFDGTCIYTAYYTGSSNASIIPTGSITSNLLKTYVTDSTIGTGTVTSNSWGLNYAIYGLNLCNGTAAQTVTLSDSLNTFLVGRNMQAGECITWTVTGTPHVTTNAAQITITLTAATAVDLTVMYKFR